jgi:hypothetical protein
MHASKQGTAGAVCAVSQQRWSLTEYTNKELSSGLKEVPLANSTGPNHASMTFRGGNATIRF